jgi:hypothetical protein
VVRRFFVTLDGSSISTATSPCAFLLQVKPRVNDCPADFRWNYWIAVAYAALGERDAAFAELENAYQAHDFFVRRLKGDPFLDPLRSDPRFADLTRRLGLPQ